MKQSVLGQPQCSGSTSAGSEGLDVIRTHLTELLASPNVDDGVGIVRVQSSPVQRLQSLLEVALGGFTA